MGIDIEDSHWSYVGFMGLRIRLSNLIGITNLMDMAGFGGDISWDTVIDPLKPFLNHSDCDGELTPEECEMIYPRLEELLPYVTDDYDLQELPKLIQSMKDHAENKTPLEFH